MVMNKYSRVRAALCWCTEIARLARQHNDANVLSFACSLCKQGASFTIADTFLSTSFEGGRYVERIKKIPIR